MWAGLHARGACATRQHARARLGVFGGGPYFLKKNNESLRCVLPFVLYGSLSLDNTVLVQKSVSGCDHASV